MDTVRNDGLNLLRYYEMEELGLPDEYYHTPINFKSLGQLAAVFNGYSTNDNMIAYTDDGGHIVPATVADIANMLKVTQRTANKIVKNWITNNYVQQEDGAYYVNPFRFFHGPAIRVPRKVVNLFLEVV